MGSALWIICSSWSILSWGVAKEVQRHIIANLVYDFFRQELSRSYLEKNSLFIHTTVRYQWGGTSFVCRNSHEGTYLIYIYRLLFGLYSLHLDVLTELYCLLLCLHCRYTSNSGCGRNKAIHISNQFNIHKRSKDAELTYTNGLIRLEKNKSYNPIWVIQNIIFKCHVWIHWLFMQPAVTTHKLSSCLEEKGQIAEFTLAVWVFWGMTQLQKKDWGCN